MDTVAHLVCTCVHPGIAMARAQVVRENVNPVYECASSTSVCSASFRGVPTGKQFFVVEGACVALWNPLEAEHGNDYCMILLWLEVVSSSGTHRR